jgi:hypothetical protein
MKKIHPFVWLSSILVLSYIGYEIYNRVTYSPVILDSGWFSDFNGQSLQLREDSTFRFCDLCLGETCFEGKYSIDDSVIVLDSAHECSRNLLMSFVIR